MTADKIMDWPTAKAWREGLENKRLVFTNGCFDLLHLGHVDYLERAAALGEALVIGLNADASVKRLKGPTRPLNGEYARARVLAALAFVQAVVVFEEDTPLELITWLQPDVLVKGGDYTIETIVGANLVQAKGGLVTTIPIVDGFSTTGIIGKMAK